MARAGGVIYEPKGNHVSTYAWELGIVTNNKVEAYALLQGPSIVISMGIRQFTIIRDSRIIIKSLSHKEPPNDFQLALILARIAKLT